MDDDDYDPLEATDAEQDTLAARVCLLDRQLTLAGADATARLCGAAEPLAARIADPRRPGLATVTVLCLCGCLAAGNRTEFGLKAGRLWTT